MPFIEATGGFKEAHGEYDFAVDGGAVSTITLRAPNGRDNVIPSGSYIMGGLIEVDTILASSGSPTVSVDSQAAADLLAATAFGSAPWASTGRKSVIPVFTGATALKTTAQRSIAITIAVAALTGGKFRVIAFYR